MRRKVGNFFFTKKRVKNLIVLPKLREVPQPNAVRNSGQKTLGGGNIKSVGYGVG